jgi:chemotaxis protein MotC
MISPRVLIRGVVLVVALSSAAPAWAGDPTPAELLFDLQNLQTSIAHGDKAAYSAQPIMLHDMGVAFSAASPDLWKNPENIHAAVAYLLSGGPPRALEPLVQIQDLPKDEDKLLHGALAYVVGREDEARNLLGGVDAKTLDLRLAGQVAFVQSMLVPAKDRKKAIELLDLARLLAPGGLVEEASLRREIGLAAEQRDVDRFTTLSHQYLSRFLKSIYAENFITSVGSMVARFGLAENVENFKKFDGLAASLPPQARLSFYLVIARGALVDGKVEAADVAAQMALLQTADQSVDQARARFYKAAARTLTGDYEASLADLNAIDTKKLPRRDVALLAATQEVAKRLHEPPNEDAVKQAALAAADTNKGEGGAMATIRLAEAALSHSDALLSGGTR